MNSLLLHLCMMVSFPPQSMPELEHIATEFNITVEEAAQRIIIERINIPGFYWYIEDEEAVEQHPYY